MTQEKYQKRISFTRDLLTDLKTICEKLTQSSCNVEKLSGSLYKKVFYENKSEVDNEINKYNTNLKEINRFRCEATQIVNNWFEFSKSPDELKKLAYPIRFRFKRNRLKNEIKKINKRISDITIENRFIKEQLLTWEKELEFKAVKEIKTEDEYSNYENLLKTKDKLIDELKYLLPTIPGCCPADINLSDIDKLISRLD